MSTETMPLPKAKEDMENVPQDGFYRQLVSELAEGVYFVDRERRITLWNRGAEQITGFVAADVIGSRCSDSILMHVDAEGLCLCNNGCPLAATMEDQKPRSAGVFLHHKDGHRVPVIVRSSPICDQHGRVIGCVEMFTDNSAQQADLERIKTLEELAFVDTLTGIANRRHLEGALTARFSEFARTNRGFGVLLIDVDHFKRFNDEHGHEAGDKVLRMVAQTMSLNCRAYDVVGRWGGEEFLVVSGGADPADNRGLAQRLCVLIAQSGLPVGQTALQVTVSIGATTVQENDDIVHLLHRVDELLYKSKAAGRNRISCDAMSP